MGFYSSETPVALVYKATWPQEKTHRTTLGHMLGEISPGDWKLSMLIVGEVLKEDAVNESRLYSADYSHRFRKAERSA